MRGILGSRQKTGDRIQGKESYYGEKGLL